MCYPDFTAQFTGDGTDFNVGQSWDCWIISGLNFVIFRACLLSREKTACMHISAHLLYTGQPKKTVIDLSWKCVGKNHIFLV